MRVRLGLQVAVDPVTPRLPRVDSPVGSRVLTRTHERPATGEVTGRP
ncbi:hypothetical protein MMX123_01069 [Microbacterium sp. MM2322]